MKWISALTLALSLSVVAGGGDDGDTKATNKIYYPQHITLSDKSDRVEALKDVVQDFARSRSLDLKKVKLKYTGERSSLIGTHYRLVQIKGLREVKNSEIIITIAAGTNKVYRIYNTLKSSKNLAEMQPLVSESEAFKIAWDGLGANAELLFQPQSKLNYQVTKNDTRLVYEILISTSSPYGHWQVLIDAQTAQVLAINDQASPTKTRNVEFVQNKGFVGYSFEQAATELNKKMIKKMSAVFSREMRTSGSAQVFNPNPNTSLIDETLNNESDLGAFKAAYQVVSLEGLTTTDNGYELKNDEVEMVDFDSPNNTISISEDGSWIYDRGTRGEFLDAMTYFHITQSMNYLKDLGFEGEKKVFRKILKVDSNGANGADNSFFSPHQNALSFGHGCVPDNEDSDVILHELGHAIQHNIVDNWSGGDTGAMGEGFGDYWASSYSLTTQNGSDFHPEWVFKWDGHNECWPGRFVNKTEMVYDHSTNYRAHGRATGGVTDELWSTPIFQAFKELYESGVKREIMDKIVIESHFGLGSGLKMRDMAQVIVQTAKTLFPNEQYAAVYKKHFQTNKILE